MSEGKGALDGIRVLDLTRVLAGPFGGQILGDLGADVIKVERPRVGDDGRRYGFASIKNKNGEKTLESSFFVCANRNKKSITVNLSKPEGQELVRRLAAQSDVLMENYKVGDLKRYGLDYESVKAVNPGIIYCSVTGYGQAGPSAARPGYDGLFQAQGGMMAVTGIAEGQPGAGPMKAGPSLVDVFTGHNAAIAVLAAIVHRQKTGHGQYIDMALLDCAVALVSHAMQDYLLGGVAPPRLGNAGNGGGPADLLACKDGIVYITAGTEEHWARLCDLIRRPELRDDPRFNSNTNRFVNRVVLIGILNAWSRDWTVSDLLGALDGIGLPAARYNELADIFKDPQVEYRGLKVTVPHPISGTVDLIASPLAYMSETPADHFDAPPTLGQHTELILRERLGLDAEQIARLQAGGII